MVPSGTFLNVHLNWTFAENTVELAGADVPVRVCPAGAAVEPPCSHQQRPKTASLLHNVSCLRRLSCRLQPCIMVWGGFLTLQNQKSSFIAKLWCRNPRQQNDALLAAERGNRPRLNGYVDHADVYRCSRSKKGSKTAISLRG